MTINNKQALALSSLMVISFSVSAESSPWLPIPSALDISFSYNQQSADSLFQGSNRAPLSGELELESYIVEAKYGISDNLAASIRTGYSESDLASPARSESGSQDTVVGLTWRLIDEFIAESNVPSVAVRVAGTIAGDYDVGRITAIADGASGVEGSVIVGKFLTDTFAVSADYGYRYRDTDVSDERFGSLSAYYLLGDQWSFNLGYQIVDAVSGNDVGDAQFTPTRFNVTEKDYEVLAVGANYRVTESYGFGVSYAEVVDGRNAPESEVFAITFDISL